jgi:hypothetical protein
LSLSDVGIIPICSTAEVYQNPTYDTMAAATWFLTVFVINDIITYLQVGNERIPHITV